MDDVTPVKLHEIHNPELKVFWNAGYEWGRRDTESERQYDRFQEAENLLEDVLAIEENFIEGDVSRLKAFFEKRIEDNA